MRRWGLISAILLLVMAPAAEASFPGKNGRIAFDRGGDIWTMRPDGSGQKRVARHAGDPAYSPDGRRILFQRGGGMGDIWVMRANGRRERKLAEDAVDPAFSPDGRWIAFERGGASGDIWVMRASGRREHRLAEDAVDPAFSPDGRWIAFSADRFPDPEVCAGYCSGPSAGIWIKEIDGTLERNLTEPPPQAEFNPEDDHAPTFSTNGRSIVFQRSDKYHNGEVWKVRPDGSGLRRVIDYGHAFDLSPDGRRIVFFDGVDGISTIRLNGRGERQIRDSNAANVLHLTFSPNGSRVLSEEDTWGTGSTHKVVNFRANGSGEPSVVHRAWNPSWGVRP